jgi:opacity protein-like surface antigen
VQQTSVPVTVVEHPLGWKLFGGWRPIEVLGAEVEYLDLGSRSNAIAYAEGGVQQYVSASAAAAFAVGYLPQPLPYFDLYGKLGVASLRVEARQPVVCPPGAFCAASYLTPPSYSDSRRARFAYGAGMQAKVGAEVVRLEYQGFSTPGGDRSLLSLDVAFTF